MKTFRVCISSHLHDRWVTIKASSEYGARIKVVVARNKWISKVEEVV